MAARHGQGKGALQPDGTYKPEATMDVKHVADTIVHIANLPTEVAMLEVNIMCVKPIDSVLKQILNCTWDQGRQSTVCW